MALGSIMLYSVSPILSQKLTGRAAANYFFVNQLKYIVVGLAAWVAASALPFWRWRQWAPWLLGAAFLSLIGLMISALAQSANGATRWVNLGFVSFQPAEALKFSLIIYLAAWLERRREDLHTLNAVVPFSIIVGVICFIIVVLQRDMGTMMVVALASLGMYFVAGIRWAHLAAIVAASGLLGWAAIVAFPHRLERLTTFLNPSNDVMNTGYHLNQALIAVGSGGLLGLGLGKSLQVYGYLPEAASDSIFAIIAEEFGLFGGLAVILLFVILGYRAMKIASHAPDAFSCYLAGGIGFWFVVQAFINIAAMVSLLPLTGIPLPFISAGGTNLVLSLLAAGILVNISKYTVREGSDENRRQRGRVSRPHLANLGSR
jgi:cell division protein FtsW